ncbi:MAG TPA: hypothetical protein VEY07_01790 [Thermoplasmata archaeon]|nr:hypothetical protein [Thermoplasmata archaeon]
MRRPTERRHPRGVGLLLLGAIVASAAFVAGQGLASLVIASGSELALGSAESASSITWWHFLTVAVDTIPAKTPTSTSQNMTIPTTLAASNASYALDPVVSGHGAIRWDFQEKNGPPAAKEFEFSVTVVNATGAIRNVTVFLETQFPVPTGPLSFSFYLDIGTGTATLVSMVEIAQQCMTITVCP